MPIQRYEPGVYPYLSTATVYDGVAYLSGLTSNDLSLDIRGQTADTLDNVDRALALAGSDKSRLLRCEIWIADMNDFEAMNQVYSASLDLENIPSRACTQSRLWHEDCLVEIMVTAVSASRSEAKTSPLLKD